MESGRKIEAGPESESIEMRIANAKTLEELYTLVAAIDEIPGSRERTYVGREKSDAMKELADFCIKNGVKPENVEDTAFKMPAPHAYGIRNRFLELLAKELGK